MARKPGTYQRSWGCFLNITDPANAKFIASGSEEECLAAAAQHDNATVIELEPPEGDEWEQSTVPCLAGTWHLKKDAP